MLFPSSNTTAPGPRMALWQQQRQIIMTIHRKMTLPNWRIFLPYIYSFIYAFNILIIWRYANLWGCLTTFTTTFTRGIQWPLNFILLVSYSKICSSSSLYSLFSPIFWSLIVTGLPFPILSSYFLGLTTLVTLRHCLVSIFSSKAIYWAHTMCNRHCRRCWSTTSPAH